MAANTNPLRNSGAGNSLKRSRATLETTAIQPEPDNQPEPLSDTAISMQAARLIELIVQQQRQPEPETTGNQPQDVPNAKEQILEELSKMATAMSAILDIVKKM